MSNSGTEHRYAPAGFMSAQGMLTVLWIGPLELAVLTTLWDTARPLTIREVRDQMSSRWPSYSTVTDVLSGLFCKRLVTRTRHHGRWYYRPAQSRNEYLADCIRAFLAEAPDPAVVLALAARPPGQAHPPHSPDESAPGPHQTSHAVAGS